MTDKDLEILREHIQATIKSTVNGKIDDLKTIVLDHNEKHEKDMVEVRSHMEKTSPIVEAYAGINTLGNLAKWFAGIVVTVSAAWALIFKQ